MQNFFYSPGVADLAYCAHPANTFDHGTYDVESGYVIVDIYYKENVHTQLMIGRGIGNLYFNNLKVLYDDDFINPFVAFGLGSSFILELEKQTNAEDYDKIKQSLIKYLGVDFENWNGADWTLFAINLDYEAKFFSN